MKKKQVTPKSGGPKPQKKASIKIPQPESSKLDKPTPAVIADSTEVLRLVQPPVTSQENSLLVELDYKILDPSVEFNLLDVYNQCFGKSVEKNDKVTLVWDSNMPKYIVPLTHSAPYFVRLCQSYYLPDQRCIVNKDTEAIFYINAESINSMLQLNPDPNAASLSIDDLTQLYLVMQGHQAQLNTLYLSRHRRSHVLKISCKY